jgi:hypothetical protein
MRLEQCPGQMLDDALAVIIHISMRKLNEFRWSCVAVAGAPDKRRRIARSVSPRESPRNTRRNSFKESDVDEMSAATWGNGLCVRRM